MTDNRLLQTTATDQVSGFILTIRETPVLVDADLATLYGVTTKALNQAVQRNIERFPVGFKFQLTQVEKNELVTNCDRFQKLKHSSALPHAFTEQGVAMISAVLKSDTAIKTSMLRQAQQSVVLIDNYIGDRVLDQLNKRAIGVSATILCKKVSRSLQTDLDRHNAQYPAISAVEFEYSHDRFLILDAHTVYHLGASLKDLGNKWFAFSKLDESGLKVMDRVKALLS